MNTVFADTAFYIAFVNPRDHWHEVAVEAAFGWRGQMASVADFSPVNATIDCRLEQMKQPRKSSYGL